MINKKVISIIMGGLLSITVFAGCSSEKSILPETIVAHAMEADESIKSYYRESRIRMYDKDNKIVEDSIMKEWRDNSNGKMRIRIENYSNKNELESVSTNNGNQVVSYMIKDKKALVMNALKETDMPMLSERDQTKALLKGMKDTHNISNEGEEKINGMNTYHIKAEAKEKNPILGKVDLWVDKNNWSIIKTVSLHADAKIEFEYTKIDQSVKMEDKLFTQELPKDVKIEDIESYGAQSKELTLKEVKGFLGKPFAYFSDSSSYKIKKITLHQYGKDSTNDEVIMEYEKNNKPYFSMSVRKEIKANNENDMGIGEEKITIRGQKGFMLKGGISIIGWSENGVSYSIILGENIENVDEFIKDLDKMILLD